MTKVSRRGRDRRASQGSAGKYRKRVAPVQAGPAVPPERVSASAGGPPASASPMAGTFRQDLPQNPHMLDDVKRIGMIAGALLIVMVILSLVI